jgi:hypothetical protein
MVMEGEEDIKAQCESCPILTEVEEVEEVAQRLDQMAAPLLPLLNRQRNNQVTMFLVLGRSVLS